MYCLHFYIYYTWTHFFKPNSIFSYFSNLKAIGLNIFYFMAEHDNGLGTAKKLLVCLATEFKFWVGHNLLIFEQTEHFFLGQ